MNTLLINSSSAYLRAHAGDAVLWRSWGADTLREAEESRKPLFLSIGFFGSHPCSVMQKESFEDAAVAALLNRDYIPVLIDREERPDLNSVYLAACTAMQGSAAWPLTVIADAAGRPIYAGAYLPRGEEDGQTGLFALLKAISTKWVENRGALISTAAEMSAYLTRLNRSSATGSAVTAQASYEQLAASFDEEYGGFGQGQKFPAPQSLLFLLRYAKLAGEKHAREIADKTLQQMYRGGIYDRFGGGFHAGTADREWLIPRFEKSLALNALLALTYTEAWQEGHLALYRTVAESTLDYILRELPAPKGLYYNGQPADANGREGGYYLLTPQDTEVILGGDDARHFAECFDITKEGNFRARSIPNLLLNQRWSLLPEGYEDFGERVRLYREQRADLPVEESAYTAPNALLLSALSRAGAVFGDRRYAAAADALYRALTAPLRAGEPLRHTPGSGDAALFLDDVVFLASALTEYYTLRRSTEALRLAASLAEDLKRFTAPDGTLFLTPSGAEPLIYRPAQRQDGELPSAACTAAALLERLSRLTGAAETHSKAEKLLSALGDAAGQYPAGLASALDAGFDALAPAVTLLCVSGDEKAPAALTAVTAGYNPQLTVLLKTPGNAAALEEAAPFTAAAPLSPAPAFYLCKNGSLTGPLQY